MQLWARHLVAILAATAVACSPSPTQGGEAATAAALPPPAAGQGPVAPLPAGEPAPTAPRDGTDATAGWLGGGLAEYAEATDPSRTPQVVEPVGPGSHRHEDEVQVPTVGAPAPPRDSRDPALVAAFVIAAWMNRGPHSPPVADEVAGWVTEELGARIGSQHRSPSSDPPSTHATLLALEVTRSGPVAHASATVEQLVVWRDRIEPRLFVVTATLVNVEGGWLVASVDRP